MMENLSNDNKYFIFGNDGGEPKVTGIRNGTSQSWLDETFLSSNPHIKEFMWPDNRNDIRFLSGIQPEFSLDLIGLTMKENAKHTDLIYFSPLLSGYIVSSKFRELLEKFNLPAHYFYQVTFHQPNKKTNEVLEIKDYWYFYFQKETGKNTVDFSRSEFDTSFHVKYLHLKEEELVVKTYEEYMKIINMSGTALKATKLTFNKEFNKDLDFWGCQFLSVNSYISKALQESILKYGITGTKVKSFERAREICRMTKGLIWECELVFV